MAINQIEREVPLAEAALRLGLSWGQAWRLVLTGVLKGRKGRGGRWLVTADSVEQARELSRDCSPSAA